MKTYYFFLSDSPSRQYFPNVPLAADSASVDPVAVGAHLGREVQPRAELRGEGALEFPRSVFLRVMLTREQRVRTGTLVIIEMPFHRAPSQGVEPCTRRGT